MPPTPTTELLEAISRLPARDAYEMQNKVMIHQWATNVVAENKLLTIDLETLKQAYATFEHFDFTANSAAMELALRVVFGEKSSETPPKEPPNGL